ncbi:TPA: glycosyltransferase [Vibrio parahaemolyticus]|nr:glycosyltransferase [Vibrio parahaemolyticus]
MTESLTQSEIELIQSSGLFDPTFYLIEYPEVAQAGMEATEHFFVHGVHERRKPNPFFDPLYYYHQYEDVQLSEMNPLLHFIHHGSKELRNPCCDFDARFYNQQNLLELEELGMEPLPHYLHFGFAQNLPISKEHSLSLAIRYTEFKDDYQSWLEANQWSTRQSFLLMQRIAKMGSKPLLSIIMPVYNPPVDFFKKAIESVRTQVYPHWELCIADDCSTDPEVKDLLAFYSQVDERIKVTFREQNGHISAATNSAAELSKGTFLVFMDQDDEITPDALAEIALYIDANPAADVIYSDDDKIDVQGKRFAPQFKPDWSPELLLSYMYFGHIFSVSRELYWKVGGTRLGFEGSQDFDLALRITEVADHIGHIPKVLYHWRVLPGSTAARGDEKDYSFQTGVLSVQEALDRRGIAAVAHQPQWAIDAGAGLFSHAFADHGPSVAIIIPTKNQADVLDRCLKSLEATTYQNYTVYIVDNESDEISAIELLKKTQHKVLSVNNINGHFSYAYVNNKAVEGLEEDLLLFLNNDTEVVNPQWLSQMVGYSQIQGVAAVGARLLYPDDNTTQHAGVVHGLNHGLPSHCLKNLSYHDGGYLSFAKVLGNFSAVTAACMLVRHDLFKAVGGFDEKSFAVAYNDADLCFRLRELGYRIAYAPSAELLHHESKSRGNKDNPQEELNYLSKYKSMVDEYYNPNLRLSYPSHKVSGRYHGEIERRLIKVAFISHNLNLEGAPIQLKEIAQGFVGHDYIQPVFVSPHEGPLREKLEECGIEVLIINDSLIGNLVGDYLNNINAIQDWLSEQNIDLVFANTVLNFWAVDAAKRTGIPALWVIHESETPFSHISHWSSVAKSVAHSALAQAYQVVFVSEATKGLFQPLASKQNFEVVYNGFDTDLMEQRLPNSKGAAREELNLKDDDVYTVIVGTVCDRKGQVDFVNAISLLKEQLPKTARFAIVGDRASEYSELMHQALDELPMNVRERVDVVKETHEVGKFYRAADIFVCCSKVESFPRVIQEAMYCELPIVTTPVFGIAEQVKDGVSALFFEKENPDELAEKMLALINDPSERERLGHNARLHLTRLPDYQHMISEYESLIFEAVQ